MTNDEKLMQQALDALQNLQGLCSDADDGFIEEITIWTPEIINALNNRLAQLEPISHAGIKIWIGNKRVVQHLTQTQLHHARDPWMLVELTADKCIAALKEKNND